MQSKHPSSSATPFEFDVVKKRKAMENSTSSDDEDDASALAAFEDFERSVLPALQRVQEEEDVNRRLEVLQLEDDMSQGKITTSGGVYFAWSSCLNCMKIGATRRDGPEARLKEISRHVTTPFVLVAWLPSPTPFRQEAAAHAHFAASRINQRGSGAGTEFFRISAAEAKEWVAGKGGVVAIGGKAAGVDVAKTTQIVRKSAVADGVDAAKTTQIVRKEITAVNRVEIMPSAPTSVPQVYAAWLVYHHHKVLTSCYLTATLQNIHQDAENTAAIHSIAAEVCLDNYISRVQRNANQC